MYVRLSVDIRGLLLGKNKNRMAGSCDRCALDFLGDCRWLSKAAVPVTRLPEAEGPAAPTLAHTHAVSLLHVLSHVQGCPTVQPTDSDMSSVPRTTEPGSQHR